MGYTLQTYRGKLSRLRNWIKSPLGTHTYNDPLGIHGIWIDDTNGTVSIREDFKDELLASPERLKLLLLESEKKGKKW
jgi:hypothetical protein